MASFTDNFNLRKDGRDDYYSIDVVNNNLDKIDLALQKIKEEAENKNGGNANTLGGKYASDFTSYEVFDSIDELSEAVYEGLFYIRDLQVTGISLKSGQETDLQPDKSVVFDNYTRIYTDTDGKLYIKTDKYYDEESRWEQGFFKSIAFEGHIHTAEDIVDFPESLPADGGNADTVGGKRVSDLAEASHTHGKSDIVDFPESLPADGGNADTVGGKRVSDLAEASHTHGKSDIVDFPESLPADGGNADTISGKNIDAIQTRDCGYSFYNRDKDWNDVIVPGYYGLMHSTSSALHNPVNGRFFYPMVFKYADDSITQIAIPHLAGDNDSRGLVYIRSKHNSYDGWSEWKPVGENMGQRTVSFSASAGNWYRIVKGKLHNGHDNSGACGIMTITADSEEYCGGDVISVAQNGSSGNFTILNHSKHNGFFNSFRMVKGDDGYMYIDAYTNLNGGLASLTFTFSGVGWNICDRITVMGSNFGSTVMEVSAV